MKVWKSAAALLPSTIAILRRIGLEPILWLAGLVLLGFLGPSPEAHLRICPFALAGLEDCPGCGLGRSIAFLFRGELAASVQAHWLGIPAAALLCVRSFTLAAQNWKRTTLHHAHNL
jgi:hypothetical protein